MIDLDAVGYLEIVKQLTDLKRGDTIWVISDVIGLAMTAREGGQRFIADRFIDSIIDVVGDNGTVLFPTFNWGFCKGYKFSMRDTPSAAGALSNASLKRSDFRRTKHPIYSFAVRGKYADEMVGIDPPNAFGEGTVFELMHKHHGKALVIGLTLLEGMTFWHHVEKMIGVPFRYEKNFTSSYVDIHGHETEKTYSFYVRDLAIDPVHNEKQSPLNEIAEMLGICRTHLWHNVPFRVVDLGGMYDLIKLELAFNGGNNFYKFSHPELLNKEGAYSMIENLIKDIAGRKLYIYGAGVRARLLAECLTVVHRVGVCGFVVTNKNNNISVYTTSKGVDIPVIEFSELAAANGDASSMYIINTVNNAIMFGIIDAINNFMREHGGAECINLTDGEHEELQFELLRDYLSTLGADVDADVLDFNGMKVCNPAKLNKYSYETLFPSLGDILLPCVYGDHRLTDLGACEFGGATIVPGKTVIDAGANVGMFSCCAAHKGCRVIAFDPSPDVLPLLLKQSDLYGGMITVVQKGLSDSNASVEFHVTPKLQGSSMTRVYEESHTVTVETLTLDEYVNTSNIDNIGFIKCDVVGAEKLFLAGARETIKKFKPNMSLHVYDNEWQILSELITNIEPRYIFDRSRGKLYAWVS